MTRTFARAGSLVLCLSLLQACGGGGGGDSNGAPNGPNHPPIAGAGLVDQHLIVGHLFELDVSQGDFFTDPDGDELTYDMHFPLPAPRGLSIHGSVISGKPKESGFFTVSMNVSDGRGGELFGGLALQIAPNHRPKIVNENPDRILASGEFIDLDVTRGGTVFTDSDGDPLSYDVRFAESGHGLTISGTRVRGSMTSVGLARVRVIARDGAGGAAEDAFSLALPGPEPGFPTLPSPSFIYDDLELDLPFRYLEARLNATFLPDTTPLDNPTTNAGATLGRVLFYDKRLSITNTVACGTCHQQSRGFAVERRFSVGAQGTPQTRNAMSLANVRYSEFDSFFWDQRVHTLEALVPIPIENPVELAQPMGMLVAKLSETGFYPPLFEDAFGSPEVTSDRIAKALAQFLRALISYRSKSDEAFLVEFPGDIPDPSLVLTAQEFRGLEIASASFCFSCHATDALIVTGATNNGLDLVPTDPGFGRGNFHPPSLKNIRVTGPYMHDGRFATLREVIDFYDHGVQDSENLDSFMEDLNGKPRRLNLTEEDKDALEAFLDTLTDHEFLADPRFSDPFQ
jgi:cytochrome c peroxidase